MAISYHVYANDGQGGDVNFATPIATAAGSSLAVGPLAAPSDTTFAVRAWDTVSGIEEANTEARVRIVIDSMGNDVTARPNAVQGLSARAMAAGTGWIAWAYDPTGQGGAPTRFDVTLTPDPRFSPSGPFGSVAYQAGVVGYGCPVSGLAGGTSYAISVLAVGVSDLLASNPATVGLDNRATLLANVASLSAVASA